MRQILTLIMAKRSYASLGLLLKAGREKSGLTQFEVSSKLGYTSPQFVSNAERGICRLPYPALRKLIQLYSLNADEVIELVLKDQEEILRAALVRNKKVRKKA